MKIRCWKKDQEFVVLSFHFELSLLSQSRQCMEHLLGPPSCRTLVLVSVAKAIEIDVKSYHKSELRFRQLTYNMPSQIKLCNNMKA